MTRPADDPADGDFEQGGGPTLAQPSSGQVAVAAPGPGAEPPDTGRDESGDTRTGPHLSAVGGPASAPPPSGQGTGTGGSAWEHAGIPAKLESGQVILDNKYTVVKKIGAGGMGEVWQVRHTMLEQDLALKLIHQVGQQIDDQTRERFRREAKVMVRINHPHAVRVYDAEVGKDRAFILMEYVKGRPLNELFKRGTPQPIERVARLLDQLCDVLQEAHDAGVVHRDLKPSNLMLLDGRPAGKDHLKVLDFGIAKILKEKGGDHGDGDAPTLTQAGSFMGTPQYASPEQARGDEIDGRSDLYTVGVILYEWLTGHRPFDGKGWQALLIEHLNTPPPPFAARNPEAAVPEAVEAMVMRCLAKKADDRYPTAAALAEAFKAARGAWAGPGPSAWDQGAPGGSGTALSPYGAAGGSSTGYGHSQSPYPAGVAGGGTSQGTFGVFVDTNPSNPSAVGGPPSHGSFPPGSAVSGPGTAGYFSPTPIGPLPAAPPQGTSAFPAHGGSGGTFPAMPPPGTGLIPPPTGAPTPYFTPMPGAPLPGTHPGTASPFAPNTPAPGQPYYPTANPSATHQPPSYPLPGTAIPTQSQNWEINNPSATGTAVAPAPVAAPSKPGRRLALIAGALVFAIGVTALGLAIYYRPTSTVTLPPGYIADKAGRVDGLDIPESLVRDPADKRWPRGDGERFVWIGGGRFFMGNSGFDQTGSQTDEDQPDHAVRLTGFYIQEKEVSNGEIERFVKATRLRNEDQGLWPERFAELKEKIGENAARDHPAVGVPYAMAASYAGWAGGRLPTEAQWEYTARSGGRDQPFVWPGGDMPSRKKAHLFPLDAGRSHTAKRGTQPDDRTAQDVMDLTGNVREWCRDVFAAYENGDELPDPGAADATDTGERVIRGSSFDPVSEQEFRTTRPRRQNARDREKKKATGEDVEQTGASDIGFRIVIEPTIPPALVSYARGQAVEGRP